MSNLSHVISLRNVYVSYDNFKALNGIDFDLKAGEIHGLVGEHRAGKSTLVKLLCGAVRKDSGRIIFKGEDVDYFTPKSAMRRRIGIVYQDLNIIPTINAVENIFTGQRMTGSAGFLFSGRMRKRAEELLRSLDTDINIDVPLSALSKQDQQMVEIAKALSVEPEILIFDEISSRLTPSEMEKIYRLLFKFKKEGKSIIYISHNMDEIFRFADRVTILQDGHRKGTEEIKDLDKIKLMKLTYSFVLSREELEKDNMELYLLEKYNENIIRNIPIGVVILDTNRCVSMANIAAVNLVGTETSRINGKSLEDILGNDLDCGYEEILHAVEDRNERSWDELKWRGDKILALKVFPLYDDAHKHIGSILLLEDVTKERYFDDYLLRTEKIASVAELAAGVAHEINTPLSVVLNYIDVFKRSMTDDASMERLKRMENELNMISGIIGSLLSFSKIQQIPMKPVNICELLSDVVLLIQHKLVQKKINLELCLPEEKILVAGDENKLKQVFLNLIINSIEAVLDGGMVRVEADLNGNDWVEIAVVDDGYGIPENIAARIFDPFFSTKAGKKNTGLGLSICQHIIESHQGVISCSSGELTRMGIRFPVCGIEDSHN